MTTKLLKISIYSVGSLAIGVPLFGIAFVALALIGY